MKLILFSEETFGKLENNYLQDHEPVALYFNNRIVMSIFHYCNIS